MNHPTLAELETGLDHVRSSPRDAGIVELIVRRPREDEREVLETGVLDLEEGLVGDHWRTKGSRRTADGSSHPDMQLNLMNARVIALVARTRDRWPLAGDQLFVDLDLGPDNVPPGTQLALGDAVIEVTDQPHNGCAKFRARFGADALRFISSPLGRALQLRGVNARVIRPGAVETGDTITKIRATEPGLPT